MSTAVFNTEYLDTDVTLAANSDVKVATQKATKAYVTSSVAAINTSVDAGFIPSQINPENASSTLAVGSFISLPFMATKAEIATGLKTWIIGGAGVGLTITAGLYEATSTGSLTSAVLKAQSASPNPVAGLNTIPFVTPYTLVPGKWYWYGFVTLGTGTITMAALNANVSYDYFTQATTTLASTAPSKSATTANWFWWLY